MVGAEVHFEVVRSSGLGRENHARVVNQQIDGIQVRFERLGRGADGRQRAQIEKLQFDPGGRVRRP